MRDDELRKRGGRAKSARDTCNRVSLNLPRQFRHLRRCALSFHAWTRFAGKYSPEEAIYSGRPQGNAHFARARARASAAFLINRIYATFPGRVESSGYEKQEEKDLKPRGNHYHNDTETR